MAITRTQVSTGVTNIASTSLADSWGATTGSGATRLLLAAVCYNTDASDITVTPPADWVLVGDSLLGLTVASRVRVLMYAIDAPGSGRSGSETFTLSSARHSTLALFEYQTDGSDIRIVETHQARDDAGATTCRAPVGNGPAGSAALCVIATRQNATGDDANQSAQTNGFTSVKELSTTTATTAAVVGGYYEKIAGIGEYLTQVTVGVGCYNAGVTCVFTDDPVSISRQGRGRKRRFRTRL